MPDTVKNTAAVIENCITPARGALPLDDEDGHHTVHGSRDEQRQQADYPKISYRDGALLILRLLVRT